MFRHQQKKIKMQIKPQKVKHLALDNLRITN